MNTRHRFRPESLGPLEARLVLSGATATIQAPAAIVQAQAATPRATLPADRDTTTFEINFLTGMVPHHRMAVDMSRLALRYAVDPQVKDLARRIIAEQTPEIRRMGRFLAVDGVRSFEPGKAPDEAQDLKELGSQRGVAFDRAFLTMMTEHHMMAIEGNDMGMVGAREAQARAAQPGIRALAGNIVATQTREIAEMQGILARLGGPSMGSSAVQAQAATSRATLPADRDTTTFEINFLTGMVPHHRMAVDMSRLALRYAVDPQVKDLARRIIAEQTPEIRRMGRFLAVDGVRSFEPGKAPDEAQDLKELGSQRGVAFDRAFLTMMTEHHMMAIEGNDMGMVGAREAQARAAQPGIRALAGNIVATQTREIAEMQGILARLGGPSMT